MNYNKNDILNYIKKNTKIKKKKINNIINNFFIEIYNYLKNNNIIKIYGLGQFLISKRKGKKWKNPITKKIFYIPSKKIIKFKVSNKLKKEINKI